MMSTPVNNLPANGNPASIPQLTQEQDTIINNVLQEMEKEMEKSTTVVKSAPPPSPPAQRMEQFQMPPMPPMPPAGGRYAHLWDLATFQKAVAAAAVAYVMLRPEVSGFLLSRVPALQQFAQYEWVLRILLLVGVFYFLMMYLQL